MAITIVFRLSGKVSKKRAKEPGGLREVKKFEPEFGAAAAVVAFLFAVY